MIGFETFLHAVNTTLGRSISSDEDPDQFDAIQSSPGDSLYIVAGPGSGKTTVMALRVLKLIIVDDVDPGSIVVTTFTKKAASELRSRILGWGDQMREALIGMTSDVGTQQALLTLDFNQIMTGTLDSISESVLKDHREPGEAAPTVIESFIANAMMVRFGLLDHGRYRNGDLKEYLKEMSGSSNNFSVSDMASTLLEIKDRICHDQVDCDLFRDQCTDVGGRIALEAIDAYQQTLTERLLYDFARIEQDFYEKLQQGRLENFTSGIRFILVDEYQDTNLLQERIYFILARYAQQNGGSITVVGDDDQSIYRFRGATVDLFTQFLDRIRDQVGITPRTIYLSRNYRSTRNIVDLINDFIFLDEDFQPMRVAEKPPIRHARRTQHRNYPVLGIFRQNIDELSQDMARFIEALLSPQGITIEWNGESFHIRVDQQRGSPNDICILCSTPQEYKNSGEVKFPGALRENLANLPTPVSVFNPRGQNIQDIPEIQVFCGLLLECIDPVGTIEATLRIPNDVRLYFSQWRNAARGYITTYNPRVNGLSLAEYVQAWRERCPLNTPTWNVREVPLVDIAYHLVSWIPEMQSDVEGLVYLEIVMRTITQSTLFTSFGGQIIFDSDNPVLEEKSIKDALQGIFVPLASGAIEINEELLETLPRNRLPIMSIHQAKGLEFPVVIVDIGSEFRTEHPKQRFKRFPEDGGKTCRMEDELRQHSPLLRPQRTGINRAFDDLQRLYFVAFSRPEDLLVLVGLTGVRDGVRNAKGHVKHIPHVATGWDRRGTWHWGPGLRRHLHHLPPGGNR